MYITQNETPYRLNICKKDIKQTLIDISWTLNLFNCKKISKRSKDCESFILIGAKYHEKKKAIDNIKNLPVKRITIWKKLTGTAIIQQEIENSNQPIHHVEFIEDKGEIYWIKKWIKQQKCNTCGRIYSSNHNCNYSRGAYYYNKIASTKNYWEPITFQPIGENIHTYKLFLVYDIETYTHTDDTGTTLLPILLCFTIFGEDELINLARKEIQKDPSIQSNETCYYWLRKEKGFISKHFRNLRENILKTLVEYLLNHIKKSNNNEEILTDYQTNQKLDSIFDINSENKDLIMSLEFSPLFLEFYIIGHNIQSFDEILLASQILQDENFPYTPLFTINRNFMPRQGRILFNDITISFPFPEFYVNKAEERNNRDEIISEAKRGRASIYTIKNVYVKSMVRDTFQITHTSLRQAAEAYGLQTSKGNCPFQAVNEFFSIGTFKKDNENFPDEKYWKSKDEYQEQKNIWKKKGRKEYDILSELVEYCCLDVILTKELTMKLLITFNNFIREEFNLDCKFNIFKRPTISSNSHAIFRQIHYSTEGRKPNQLPDIFAPSKEMYSFVRKSVRGGRCYPTHLGKYKKRLYVYDICGMYASALTHPLPYGIPVGEKEKKEEIDKFQMLLNKNKPITYFSSTKPMIIAISALPPPKEYLDPLPPICSRKSGKLCWTNEPILDEVVTSIDAITLNNRGWSVKILNHPLNTVFPQWKTSCLEYVKANIIAKEKASKENNPVKRAISKLLSNALYGSFATKEDNDVTIFEQSMTNKIREKINNKSLEIKTICSLPTEDLPNTAITNLQFFQKEKSQQEEKRQNEEDELNTPFECPPEEDKQQPKKQKICHVTQYKPFNVLNVTSDSITIYMLKSSEPHPTNKRYPTQLASFVLAWTRCFISEWSEILYRDEKHLPIEKKTVKAIYGDTDSLFLTEKGHNMMLKYGKDKIKKSNSKLIFDATNPSITWAVECETFCDKCKTPAFTEESIFLAPKLYALKTIKCPVCKTEKGGKIRAKGHATDGITFNILEECFQYHKNCQGERKYTTERKALKRTLCSSYGKYNPFTIHEINLIRELRPWKSPTLHFITETKLIPYDLFHRNPRITQPLLVEEFTENEC